MRKRNKKKNRISISERCENVKTSVIDHIENHDIHLIHLDISEEAMANDSREEFVFQEYKMKGRTVSIVITSVLEAIFLVVFLFYILVAIFSNDYSLYGLIAAAVSLAVIILNFLSLRSSFGLIRFHKRYNDYYSYFKNKKCVLIDDVSRLYSLDRKKVLNDLKRAIRLCYIPQGQIVNNDKLIIFSSDSFAEYSRNRAEIDSMVNRLLVNNQNEDDEYEKVIAMIETSLELLNRVKKQEKKSVIKKELEIMERMLKEIKCSNDLVDDDQATITTFVICYCTSMEKLIESYLAVRKSRTMFEKNYYGNAKEEHREAMEYVNDAFENILYDYYEVFSII